jgi:hypothetical protein
MRRFPGDRSVVGKKVLVNSYPMTIVGVSAAGFSGVDPARSPKIRVPIQMLPIVNPGWDTAIGYRRLQRVRVFARLKPGYTVESAQASLQVLFAHIRRYEATLPKAAILLMWAVTSITFRPRNLPRAVSEMDILMDILSVYDNTCGDANHPLVLQAQDGEIRFLEEPCGFRSKWGSDSTGSGAGFRLKWGRIPVGSGALFRLQRNRAPLTGIVPHTPESPFPV